MAVLDQPLDRVPLGGRSPGVEGEEGHSQGRPGPAVRPRSAAALQRGGRQEPLNTSVAVRSRRGPGRKRQLTAMAVGPQAPPGSPPRPRQVIIPAGSVDEHDTTVLDVPAGSPLEQPQRVIIPPGTIHPDETMVVVVPAPRTMAMGPSPHYNEAAEAAAAEAERQRREHEERVREAKLAYYSYIESRPGPEAERLRHLLLHDRPPAYEPYPGYVDREARRVERDLWEQDMPEVPDIDVDPDAPEAQPYRLQMSMNIEEYPAGGGAGGLTVPTNYQGTLSSGSSPSTWTTGPWSPQSPPGPPSPPAWGQRFDEAMGEYDMDLSDIEPPESLYGEDAGWEPPPPPAPLIAPPYEEEPIIPQSPPRYVYQRPAPHDPGDLMWDWEEPPRPVFEMPIIEPEPYSAELFRLVRL